MIIGVNRYLSTNDATLSEISVDGERVCYGLEDGPPSAHTSPKPRIAAGGYKITLRTVGGFHQRYHLRFPGFHKGMLWIRDVPEREYILIHCGNTHEDTAGCLLVGLGRDELKMTISASVAAYKKLYQMAYQSAADGQLLINIEDNDK